MSLQSEKENHVSANLYMKTFSFIVPIKFFFLIETHKAFPESNLLRKALRMFTLEFREMSKFRNFFRTVNTDRRKKRQQQHQQSEIFSFSVQWRWWCHRCISFHFHCRLDSFTILWACEMRRHRRYVGHFGRKDNFLWDSENNSAS